MYDVVIIGGGIVGLATARALLQRLPGLRLLVLEKESQLAQHQTGHNSGVIHSGIYYQPGSLKAKLCVEGAQRLTAFCDEQGIPYRRCGKVIVAVDEREIPALERLSERGRANGVPGLARLDSGDLRRIEPNVRGLAAVHLPHVAVVDFARVAQAFAEQIARWGGQVQTSQHVVRLQETSDGWRLSARPQTYGARVLVNCGGLHADRLAQLTGERARVRIIPFRGEYYTVPAPRASMVNGLVYPVPDPAMPFLGVHFTKTPAGGLHVGPNAVLAFKREGYRRRDVSWRDTADLLTYPGFWRMAGRHWRAGLLELNRSWNPSQFLRAAQRLVPSLTARDLIPGSAGVRAQAVGLDGTLLDDFVVDEAKGAVHVYNAPSPAATASLSIGEHVAARVCAQLGAKRY